MNFRVCRNKNFFNSLKRTFFLGLLVWFCDLRAVDLLQQAVIDRDYEIVEKILRGEIGNRSIPVNQETIAEIKNYRNFIVYRSHQEVKELLETIFGKYGNREFNNWLPLNWAVFNDDLSMVKLLLEYEADPNSYDKINATPLHWASLWSSSEIIKELVNRGAKFSIRDNYGFTPLYRVLTREPSRRDLDIIKFFISRGARVTRKDKRGRNAFHIAAMMSYLDALTYLASVDPRLIHSLDGNNNNALHWVVSRKLAEDNSEVIRTLLLLGVGTDTYNNEGLTPFHVAVYRRNLKAVRIFLESKLDPHIQSRTGDTLLHIAARWGYADIIKIFYDFFNPGKFEFIRTLEGSQINPNILNDQGYTPLHVALYNNHILAAKEILNFPNTNPLDYDANGQNGLHLAARSRNLELMHKMIIRARTFDVEEMFSLENKQGQRPIEVAAWHGDVDMVLFLIKKGGLVSTQHSDIIRLLANARSVEMERLLLKLKNNPQTFDFD